MKATGDNIKLSKQSARILKLLFKFRFVTAQSLANVMGIKRYSVYEVLERLVTLGLVVKVYEQAWRIDRKAAYYYLGKPGVTAVRVLLDVKEPVVHALYKNEIASSDFIEHCLAVLAAYGPLTRSLPNGSDIFTKAEINRFKQFPKNRPDLFVRTPIGQEAMIIFVHDIELYQAKKRFDELIQHSEDEGWDGPYPLLAFVLKNGGAKNNFLYSAAKKIDDMGIDQDDLMVFATTLESISSGQRNIWSSVYSPNKYLEILE